MNDKWPEHAVLRIPTRWRVREGKEAMTPGRSLHPETVALLTEIQILHNRVVLWINPAIAWEGTYQELNEMWENVPDYEPLTF